ncbi:MAG: ABC transporter substrate-binding protein [Lentisphaerae bacterium]|nr:ABC transporter substrate-binding protein [Lentisphaerota bacterium]
MVNRKTTRIPMTARPRPGLRRRCAAALVLCAGLAACTNNPYRPGETAEPALFAAFSTPPTKLDPTSAYYVHEGQIIDQIYEPPFTYHYLKRPYEVIPLTAEAVPQPVYYDGNGRRIADPDPPSDAVARAEYTIRIKPGIRYQDHPCFAAGPDGQPLYAGVPLDAVEAYESPNDFPHRATRALRAEDYALQIRRLADPRLASPVFSTLSAYIDGLRELSDAYAGMLEAERARRRAAAGPAYNRQRDERENPIRLDYFAPDFPGVTVHDALTFTLALKRKYPQIRYWLCMHFFAPVPPEAVAFYTQPAMIEKQFSLNRWPVGTGPYFLKIFRPNETIVLERNPNYHPDAYPADGMPEDRAAGLLDDAGRRVPFIHRQVMHLEKEAVPAWNKFLQGYLDASGVSVDVFDQAIQIQMTGEPTLSPSMESKGIRLITDIDTTLWYTAFNMLDDVVGGYAPEQRKLRRAVSIALDYNEFLDIFLNGRGVLAQGPLPPGIFGHRPGPEGTNPYVDTWDPVRERHARRPLSEARRLMAEAGYPEGRTPGGEPLTLYYDHAQGGDTFFRSYFEWVRGRLDTLGIRLRERATDLSRYRQKRDQGNWQISSGGWLADYPDPENFLFLFYGPNGKVAHGGPNMVNYVNPEYDALFERMESMRNTPERQALIDAMLDILRRDAPAVWQYHPVSYILAHPWLHNVKPHNMSYNTIKYRRVDPDLRVRQQRAWNRPVWWPLAALAALLVLSTVPAAVTLYRRNRCSPT